MVNSFENSYFLDYEDMKGNAADPASGIGNKFKNLAVISGEFNIPEGVCIRSKLLIEAFADNSDLMEYTRKIFNDMESTSGCFLVESISEFEDIIDGFKLPEKFRTMIEAKLSSTFGDISDLTFAVRSSCLHEDSAENSFAGIYETFLNTKGFENIIKAVEESIKAYYSYSAITARIRTNNYYAYPEMDVFVQLMLDSKVSGVAFSSRPDGKDGVLVEWVNGLGESLVSGLADAGTYYPDDNMPAAKISDEPRKILDEVGNRVRKIRDYFGYEVDVEWGWDGNALYILQVRPITTARALVQESTPKMDIYNLYTDKDIANKAVLGECRDIYFEYTNKRSPAYILADKHNISTGQSFFAEFNRSGLESCFDKLMHEFEKSMTEKVVIDINKSIRQNIIQKEDLYTYLDRTFKGFGQYEVHSMIIRDFIKGEYGFISQILENNRLLIECSKDGLLAINRGLADCEEIILEYDDMENFSMEGVEKAAGREILEQFNYEALKKVLRFTRAMNNTFNNTKLEWVLSAKEPYFIDFSMETSAIDYSGTDDYVRVIYSGIAEGPIYRIDDEDIFSRLSISPGVSVTKVNEVVKSNDDLYSLIDKIKGMEVKPVIVCKKPYAILSFLIDHASGFIFTEGAILCHMSILLRESKIPSVIVKNAEELLENRNKAIIAHKKVIGVIE